MSRYVNLVLQGGGVRGLAYAAALESFPPVCRLHSVAGTSAGAIVAALLAVGHEPTALTQLLQDESCRQLVDTTEGDGGQVLAVAAAARDTLSEDLGFWRAAAFVWKHRSALSALHRAMTSRGLFPTTTIEKWLSVHLGDRRFKDITIDGDLKIVAADVARREFCVYTKLTHPNKSITEAVLESLSIPIFFHPQNKTIVDGGLLSNFPSFLFQDEAYPTIGLRLRDLEPEDGDPGTFRWYLGALLATMLEAHDKRRSAPQDYREFVIVTEGVRTTDFRLDDEKVQALLNAGRRVGATISWETIASEGPSFSYVDAKPQQALERCMRGSQDVWALTARGDTWVDEIAEETLFRVVVDRDWTTHYSRRYQLQTKGERLLYMGRLFVRDDADQRLISTLSIADVPARCDELLDDRSVPQILVPAINNGKTKGFLIFYDGPIEQGTRRTFETGFSITQEFARSLGMGRGDSVGLTLQQRARHHTCKLRIELWFSSTLPIVTAQPNFRARSRQTERLQRDGEYYQVDSFDLDTAVISTESRFNVALARPATKPPGALTTKS